MRLAAAAAAAAAAHLLVCGRAHAPGSGAAHNEFEAFDPSSIRAVSNTNNCALSIEEPAAPPRLIDDGGYVTVSWRCDALPAADAWIGAYSPPPQGAPDSTEFNASITSTYPVRMSLALTAAAGSVRMQFTNFRAPLLFALLSGGNVFRAPCCPLYYVNATTFGSPVAFRDPNQPVRPRLVMVGSTAAGRGVRLLWGTNNSAQPTVEWGTAPGVAGGVGTTAVGATTRVLRRDEMFNRPASTTGWHELGAIHSAELDLSSLLQPAAAVAPQRVYYRFGDAGTDTWSPEYVFVPPPPPGANATRSLVTGAPQPLSIGIVCDFGRGSMDDSITWIEYGRPAINTTRVLRGLAGLAGGDDPALLAVGGHTISAVIVGGDHRCVRGGGGGGRKRDRAGGEGVLHSFSAMQPGTLLP